MNYASLAFTEAVRDMQEKLGSRKSYARLENRSYVDGLTGNETGFISDRDSFYMATIGENGYPYIQHRGGPQGFIKVLDTKQLGIIDYKGNAQYITVGNITTNNNVALIMVDYPTRTRLKLYAKARIVEPKDDPALYARLDLEGYEFRPERMMVFDVEAYDWNCQQHITPRYSIEEINKAFASQSKYILQLEAELKKLKERPVADG
ncbi:pyridoxamine 5'-phosphate oxidase [Chitinophaga oryziterrae]|uniref:Pyridoxamine 5'-phosphate oxidase n=1 Tax=Chitinophaga oryziterrae TaxID=1031224 RepID=A0A6N8JEV2_9BACT|nr:pyridoxamine 5'-phosphate oxidase family protein [Chitinophaga oryziterrae]MVT42848.1 pyridoxamine 5'-phosphate oxidase [Chitinophaga oryziterrae]